ncbi:hypothetical protein V2O64_19320 [Verrucomicrobiaceae bacterium 227]
MNAIGIEWLRIAIPVFRLFTWYRALWIFAVERALIAPPLQKLAVIPMANLAWAILAVTPFVVLRHKRVFVAYAISFSAVLGIMAWDWLIPFRYVSQHFHGEIIDSGGGFSTSGNRDDIAYWISYPTNPSGEDVLLVMVIVAPLALGCIYRMFFQRWTK